MINKALIQRKLHEADAEFRTAVKEQQKQLKKLTLGCVLTARLAERREQFKNFYPGGA